MPDTPQAEKPTKRKASTPRQPPKELPQDYSSLPQKPIKLKSDVSLPPVLKRSADKQQTTKSSTPSPTKPKKRKPTQRPTKVLADLSPQAREIVIAAAAEQKMEPITWLEQLIMESQQHEAPVIETDTIANSLQMIEQRLARLEDQRGFWSRFWEQFMEPYRRQQ
ncbi:MAG: hypothetical protein P8098_00985 [Candidatus Thiodiazotropha sp.]